MLTTMRRFRAVLVLLATAGACLATFNVRLAPADATITPFVWEAGWGTLGGGNNQFNRPLGIGIDSDNHVFVADTWNNRVSMFDRNGSFIRSFAAPPTTGNFFPTDVAADNSGRIYALDSGSAKVSVYEVASGNYLRTLNVAEGVSIDIHEDTIYVLEGNNEPGGVSTYDLDGNFIDRWGGYGTGDGEFLYHVWGIATDTAGDVYVSDTSNDRIQKFDSTGRFLTAWPTIRPGETSTSPRGVSTDNAGHVFVVDRANNLIKVFDSSGTFLTSWGSTGTGHGQFQTPVDSATDALGRLFVLDCGYYSNYYQRCDTQPNVQRFGRPNLPGAGEIAGTVTETTSGGRVPRAWVAVLRSATMSLAAGAVADASGNYVVGDLPAGSYYLYVIDPTGAHTAGFHGPPTTVTVTAGNVTDADPAIPPTSGSVAGTVTEQGTGSPIGGAWVIGINATTGATQRGAVADGAGHYNIAGLRSGSYRPVFVDPTGAHASRYFPNSVDFLGATSLAVTAGGSTAANVALPTQSTPPGPASLSGTVREAGTNTALGGVFVVALRASDFRNAGGAVTNASGQYSLNVAAGAYKLAFVDSTGGHNMEWHNNQPNTGLATATSVTAPAVTNATLDANTGSMAGTVTDDPSGDPVAGAWVVVIGPTGAIAGGAVTAPDGTYTIAGLAPGTYRATFVDPKGGRTQEYYNNSPNYAGATPFNVTAAGAATINAALHYP